MWRPRRVGEVIAERKLFLKRRGRRSRVVWVKFGRPVRSPAPERGDPWWCPVQVTGLGRLETHPVAGEDSLQALVLALEFVTKILPFQAKKAGGKIEWLGERERPVFANTFLFEMYETALSSLVVGIQAGLRLLEGAGGSNSRRRERVLEKLRTLAVNWGFEGKRAPQRKRRPTRRSTRRPAGPASG